MKSTRATATDTDSATAYDHHDRTTPSAEADPNRDDVLEAGGRPTFGLVQG
jgi:hypothetical protein